MAKNPWEQYLATLGSGNYAGSSGYWGDASDKAGGTYRFGMGYPGDRAKAALANAAGVQAGGTVGALQLPGAGRTSTGSSPSIASRYEALQIPKSQMLINGANSLAGKFNAGTGDIPGFDDLLASMKGASGDITQAYNNQKKSFDLTDFAAGQRGADARAAGLTDTFSTNARAIGDRYAASDAKYAGQVGDIIKRGYDLLPSYDAAANAIGDEQVGKLLGDVNRYKIAGGNLGLGGDELRKIARGVGDIRLPLEREKIGQRYNLLQNLELPGDREIASRNAARYSGFDMPLEQQLYGAKQGDVLRGKATDAQLKQLEMSVANMSVDAAANYLKSLSIPANVIQEILQRHNATLGGQISNLGALGNVEDSGYYRGLNYLPGANVSQPGYYPSNTGGYPSSVGDVLPNRYGGSAPTSTASVGSRYGGAPLDAVANSYSNNPMSPQYLGQGVYDLPNDYNWGRNADQQKRFQEIQKSYE